MQGEQARQGSQGLQGQEQSVDPMLRKRGQGPGRSGGDLDHSGSSDENQIKS